MSAAYERFREMCLSLPETSEVFVENWGHPLNAPKRLARAIADGLPLPLGEVD